MKRNLFLMVLLTLLLIAPVFAQSATYEDSIQYVNQRQWRSRWHAWGTCVDFDDSGPFYTYKFAGSTVHEWVWYSPPVTDQEGGHFVYTLKGPTATVHGGVISYTSPYSGLTVYEVWSGSLTFAGFVEGNPVFDGGWLNQWGFVYGPDPILQYPYRIDMGGGWWLVGFSTYAYGSDYANAVTNSPSGNYPGGAFWTLALSPPHVP